MPRQLKYTNRRILKRNITAILEDLSLMRIFINELRKATIRFVMSVCPSVRMEQFDSHWTDFHEI